MSDLEIEEWAQKRGVTVETHFLGYVFWDDPDFPFYIAWSREREMYFWSIWDSYSKQWRSSSTLPCHTSSDPDYVRGRQRLYKNAAACAEAIWQRRSVKKLA